MDFDHTKNNLPEAVGVSLRRADQLIVRFIALYTSLDGEEYSKNKLYGYMAKYIHTIGEAYFMGSYIEFYLNEALDN